MKKKILLSLFAIMVIASASQAQTFIASFGTGLSWGVPHRVSHFVEHNYSNYNCVHAKRVAFHGGYNFEVVLQRGDIYIELNLDPFGNVIRSVRRDYYPLYDHICGGQCGYHANYYQAFYSSCNSHSHHGHNHINYYYNNGYAHRQYNNNGNAYGHYKNKHNYYTEEESRSDNKDVRRVSYENSYPTRRGELHNERDNDRGRKESGYSRGSSNQSNGNSKNSRSATQYNSRSTSRTAEATVRKRN